MRSSMRLSWKRVLSGAWVLNDTKWAHHRLPKPQSSLALIAQRLIRDDETRVKNIIHSWKKIHSFMKTNIHSSMKTFTDERPTVC